MNILYTERKALVFLSLFHILVIISSNYLVQFPFDLNLYFIKVTTTPGAFTFPLVFLATDLTVRVFGATLARKIVFIVMLPALVASYIISVIFMDGSYVGTELLSQFNKDIFRIALASFSAYSFGQLMDVTVFNRLRKLPKWWVAPMAATVAGSALDTFLFFSIAFYKANDVFMAENWFSIGFIDYLTKLVISLLFTLPLYGILLKHILKKIKNSPNKL